MHFTVAVFSNGGLEEVDMLLAPYCEHDERLFRFIDKTEEALKEWREGTTEAIRMPNGTVLSKYDKMFTFERKTEMGFTVRDYDASRFGFVEEEMSFRERYPTFDLFVTDYHEYKIINNRCGYFGNERGEWDWEVKGGRWDGTLFADPGLPYDFVKPSFDTTGIKGYNFTNSGRVMYIDWKEMDKINMRDCKLPFATYAVITPDGKWYYKGEKWRNDLDENWADNYHSRFVTPNWGATVTIVDCHV